LWAVESRLAEEVVEVPPVPVVPAVELALPEALLPALLDVLPLLELEVDVLDFIGSSLN
jgi:hypothetical protein